MPCQELFDKQSEEYKKSILEEGVSIITLEAGSISCWNKYVGEKGMSIGVEDFGKSAPYNEIYNHFGLTSDKVVEFARKMLKR